MTPRAAVRLAWGLWGLAVALIAVALAINAAQLPPPAWPGVLALLSLVFITVGAFLAGRRPGNAVGWLLAFLLLLFPHGRLPSRRWRPFVWLTIAVYATLSLSAALSPKAVHLYYPQVTSPVHLPVAPVAGTAFDWLLGGQLLVLGTALVSLVLRLRRAPGEERQQVKWFVYTVATVVLVFVATTLAVASLWLRSR